MTTAIASARVQSAFTPMAITLQSNGNHMVIQASHLHGMLTFVPTPPPVPTSSRSPVSGYHLRSGNQLAIKWQSNGNQFEVSQQSAQRSIWEPINHPSAIRTTINSDNQAAIEQRSIPHGGEGSRERARSM